MAEAIQRCRVCLAAGVDGFAVPGLDLCQIHSACAQRAQGSDGGGASGSSLQTAAPGAMDIDTNGTGLTQQLAATQLADVAVPPPHELGQQQQQQQNPQQQVSPSTAPPGLAAPLSSIANTLLREWLEDEVLSHFHITQANNASQQPAPEACFQIPSGWAQLEGILKKIGYHVDSDDPWRALGYAMYEGPEPTEQLISGRLRTVKYLCSLVDSGTWSQDDAALRLKSYN